MTRLFKLGFGFLLGLHILQEDSILDLDLKYILFHSLEIIFAVFSQSTVAHFYHVCCISCLPVVSSFVVLVILLQHLFILFTVLPIILAKPFLLKLSYFFVITCFTIDMNQSLFCHMHVCQDICVLLVKNICHDFM